jgi:DNA-directed RNA polymerase subunit RPC12/RpoP
MAEIHCPGQDLRYWKLDDVYEVVCVHCGARIEFFKDDPRRRCKACDKLMLNPRNDMSCAQWCKHAKECLESLGADAPEFH